MSADQTNTLFRHYRLLGLRAGSALTRGDSVAHREYVAQATTSLASEPEGMQGPLRHQYMLGWTVGRYGGGFSMPSQSTKESRDE